MKVEKSLKGIRPVSCTVEVVIQDSPDIEGVPSSKPSFSVGMIEKPEHIRIYKEDK